MANPRKFSEKIALHNQKQAEETAAFEAILRDVSVATRGPAQKPYQQHLQLQPQYKGGSLPNVNQMATNSSIDLQTALQHLEDMRSGGPIHNRMDNRMHMRDTRGRQPGPHRRALPIDKQRTDCSPYGSPYLPLPPDPSGWRRTNSDSALHQSASMVPQMNTEVDNMPSPTTPPAHKRIQEMVGDSSLDGMRKVYWDPKQEQENQGVHVPITNNTGGSLPDLTVLHFPPPLTTPLDAEDQNYSQGTPANLSPTHAHQMGIVHSPSPGSPQAQSPAQRRRPLGGPSPLVLSSSPSQQMRLPAAHSPPVSVPNVDPSKRPMDPRYMLYMQQRQRVPNCVPQHIAPLRGMNPHQQLPSPPSNHQNHSVIQPSPPGQQQRVPQVCITSPEQNESQPSIAHYRNNVSEGNCQSPTSPHSQTSYSPSQSPGLPPANWNNSPFTDSYQLQQQQQQTQALQHQFEQFNMSQDNHFITTSDTTANGVGCGIYTSRHNSSNFSQAPMHGTTSGPEYQQQVPQQQFYSPQLDMNSQNRVVNHAQQHPQSPHGNHHSNKIPDIIFTGVDDSQKHDFNLSKELGNAIMSDSFDTDDLFPGDEALKLGQLDLDGLQIQQMLNDPNMIADPATEESFKLDRL
ncbi:hypothetical protein FSP39_019196 [Pinctada imbricata]|uniref:CREB-regulated transcription coactivator 1 n=1 Tax=Pinctada imbricata TaxID=66713 RepID=A0AA88Y4M2_PINIB|nr:hypothetical protein FSP39_019196 [Pinctada imbricata]